MSLSSPPATPSSPMAQRLQYKQTIIDKWSTAEQIGLIAAVQKAGEQNWVSVARQVKPFGEPGRPADWFTQKNCAQQYDKLVSAIEKEMPKRKRGETSAGSSASAKEEMFIALFQKLYKQRIEELNVSCPKIQQDLKALEDDLDIMDDEPVPDEEIERIFEKEEQDCEEDIEIERKHQEWLKEREEKKMALQAALKVVVPLSSGRKSIGGTQSSTVKKMPAFEPEEEPKPEEDKESEDIEQATPVKSQENSQDESLLSKLLQSPTTQTSPPPPKEKTEEVEEDKDTQAVKSDQEIVNDEDVKDNSETTEEKDIKRSDSTEEAKTTELPESAEKPSEEEKNVEEEEEVEIKKEKSDSDERDDEVEEVEEVHQGEVDEEDEEPIGKRRTTSRSGSGRTTRGSVKKEVVEDSSKSVEEDEDSKSLPPPPPKSAAGSASAGSQRRKKTTSERSNEDNEDEHTPSTKTRSTRGTGGSGRKDQVSEEDTLATPTLPENKRVYRLRVSDLEVTSGGQGRGRRGSGATSRSSSPTGSEDTRIDRGGADSESEPGGRKTRSRRRSGKHLTPAGIPDFDESAPSSPASSAMETPDDELWNPDPKIWKKQGLLLWHELNLHRFAPTFHHPVSTSETASSNSLKESHAEVVLKPIDLVTIKRAIENGAMKNVWEMQTQVMHMLLNAVMFHSSDSEIYKRALVMAKDCTSIFETYRTTQLFLRTSGSNAGSPLTPRESSGQTPALPSRKKDESRKRAAEEANTPGASAKKRRK